MRRLTSRRSEVLTPSPDQSRDRTRDIEPRGSRADLPSRRGPVARTFPLRCRRRRDRRRERRWSRMAGRRRLATDFPCDDRRRASRASRHARHRHATARHHRRRRHRAHRGNGHAPLGGSTSQYSWFASSRTTGDRRSCQSHVASSASSPTCTRSSSSVDWPAASPNGPKPDGPGSSMLHHRPSPVPLRA